MLSEVGGPSSVDRMPVLDGLTKEEIMEWIILLECPKIFFPEDPDFLRKLQQIYLEKEEKYPGFLALISDVFKRGNRQIEGIKAKIELRLSGLNEANQDTNYPPVILEIKEWLIDTIKLLEDIQQSIKSQD